MRINFPAIPDFGIQLLHSLVDCSTIQIPDVCGRIHQAFRSIAKSHCDHQLIFQAHYRLFQLISVLSALCISQHKSVRLSRIFPLSVLISDSSVSLSQISACTSLFLLYNSLTVDFLNFRNSLYKFSLLNLNY